LYSPHSVHTPRDGRAISNALFLFSAFASVKATSSGDEREVKSFIDERFQALLLESARLY
jgi:hypothetical protein